MTLVFENKKQPRRKQSRLTLLRGEGGGPGQTQTYHIWIMRNQHPPPRIVGNPAKLAPACAISELYIENAPTN